MSPARLDPAGADCPECGGTGFFRADVPVGDPRFGRPVRCQNPVHATQAITRLGSLTQMVEADTRLRLSDITPLPGNEAMLKKCRQMLDRPWGWLYLWGGPGNAKTVALKAMCNHLSAAGYRPVVYIKFTRLVEIMRAATAAQYGKKTHFEQNGGNMELWDNGPIDAYNRLLAIKVLAIEEFDKARETGLMEEFRFDFLDDRYEQALRGETITMFASQLPPEAMPGPLESRVNDGRFMVVENRAGDTRPTTGRAGDEVCLP